MTTTSPQQTWANAIPYNKPAKEFPLTPLKILSGQIPPGLRGTLYRNGPARLTRGGDRVGHWFDGDGAILAIHFTDSEPQGIYRFIQTEGYLAESQADRFLYSNYGMTEPRAIWNLWKRVITGDKPLKNTANTSVIALPDKLLALWEGGHPHALDLQTIETFGADDLGGLGTQQPYSAHPKLDPQTGEIFNMGISMGVPPKLNIYKSDRTGKILKKNAIAIDNIAVVHSFVLAGPYLVFLIPPMQLNALPVAIGFKSYSESFQWQGDRGTQIIVVDRNTLEVVSRGETDPWFQWHFGNGCIDADGLVVLDLVRFADFLQTNEYLREVATGKTQTQSYGSLWQVRLDPKTAKVTQIQQAVDRDCEFPSVPPHQVGQPWRYTYLALHRPHSDLAKDWFEQIGYFDYKTETLTETDLGESRYPMEPIYAADPQNPDRGWLLTVIYDGNKDASEVWIFESDRLNNGPICQIELPEVIPLGFHGTWNAA